MKGNEAEPVGDTTARDKSNEYLANVLAGVREDDGVRERYGAQIVLGELLSKRLGAPVSRHAVNRWLHYDPDKRKQPPLGIGILLREIFNANKAKITAWKASKRRRPRRTNKQIENDERKQNEET